MPGRRRREMMAAALAPQELPRESVRHPQTVGEERMRFPTAQESARARDAARQEPFETYMRPPAELGRPDERIPPYAIVARAAQRNLDEVVPEDVLLEILGDTEADDVAAVARLLQEARTRRDRISEALTFR